MDQNKKSPMKLEFIFQMGIIIFIALGTAWKPIAWFFWCFAVICAISWMIVVHREKGKKNNGE